MSTKFTHSIVGDDRSVGERLRAEREERGLSLQKAATRTRIPLSHLEAFEADRFDALPSVYIRGFLRRYASFLGLDPDQLTKPYLQQERLKRATLAPPRRERRVRLTITPRRLVRSGAVLVTLVLLVVVFREVRVLAETPQIHLEPAATDDRTGEQVVRGHTTRGSELRALGLAVPVRDDGTFEAHFILPEGPSRLEFIAKSPYGKQISAYQMVSSYPPDAVSGSDPVALRVEVTDRPVHLRVRAPGRTVFDGTMAPGAVHVFYGTDLTLSTSDAGRTSVSVSNRVVQARDIGLLGRAGEEKKDLRIQADTEIQ